MQGIASRLGVELLAIEFGPRHCHIFVGNCRRYSVSQLAQYFKGGSSRYLRQNYWDNVRNKRLGKAFWTAGYFYESVGRVTSDTVRYYIERQLERQQGKHWAEEDYDVHIQRQGQTSLEEFGLN